MKEHDVYPSQWLSAGDMDGPLNVTVKGVTVEQIGKDKETKPVLWVEELDKGLILNKTNFRNMALLTGQQDTDDWAGHKVQFYSTRVQFGGEEVDAVRIRMVKATAPAKPASNGNGISAAAQQAWGKFYNGLTAKERNRIPDILEGAKPSAWMATLSKTVDECIEFVKAGLAETADPANF